MIFCTTASKHVLPELRLLRKSMNMFLGGHYVLYVLWSGERSENMPDAIYQFDQKPFDLKTVGGLKSRVLTWALESSPKVFFVDCDVLFLGDWVPNIADGVTFSRHLSNNEEPCGRYNSGFIGVVDKSFPAWWDKQPKEVPGWYGDQKCLELWQGARHEFPEQQNVGFWRWWDAPKYARPGVREAHPDCFRMETHGDKIIYNGAPLLSVHTHILRSGGANAPLSVTFNRIVLKCMKSSTDPRHQELYQTIMAQGANA